MNSSSHRRPAAHRAVRTSPAPRLLAVAPA
ncbi:hypothetical protein ACVJ1F_000776 [Frigoribacterium sp. 2355]